MGRPIDAPVDDDEFRARVAARPPVAKVPRASERVAVPLRDDTGRIRRSALRADRLP